MIRAALLLLCLGACAMAPSGEAPTRAVIADSTLPPMKTFSRPQPRAPRISNANLATDFQALHFQLESGRTLPTFTRFETPITVAVTGNPPPSLGPDLRRLLARLRNEAGIDISSTASPDANIIIEAVSRDDIRRALPQAACFVIPNVSSLAEFRRMRRNPRTNWANLTQRTRMAIFLPYDASPQEVRDCLHEELAQSLGPLNDLYRLTDSVFNDDNVHTVLTGYDMLILRMTYAPELQSGMTQQEIAAQLPSILARLNPGGVGLARQPSAPTPRSWVSAVQTALGPGASAPARRSAVNAALRIARTEGWTDHRRAFSHYIAGRMIQIHDPAAAQSHYALAMAFYEQTPRTELHRAYLATQIAAFAITQGDGAAALRAINPALPVARQAENAALLATLQMLKAEALGLTGRPDQARAVRLDSLGWARYGFGSDWAVRGKLREIAALNPLRQG
ncbi:DUF2927 domain-containing protein [Thalassococcus sp. S3]|uniref:DUF2927 domain-containing protein n=1 Tax=Thalassococcus sp. S3 TaxID=2017482 RepID=UPI0010243EE7|nr:DUF2927 domain-containing protein [Thalassococcus sp. S3]QBF31559.1 ATP-dependent transcriptional regulator [Thalassococcus sp. S3]